MVERGEVLSKVKSYDARDLLLLPTHSNQVGKECSCILSRVLMSSTKLTEVKDANLLGFPLKAPHNHFLKEFTQAKHLSGIILGFPKFGDNYSDRLLEPFWPMAKEQACVSNTCEQGMYSLSLDQKLEVKPVDMIWARRRPVRTTSQHLNQLHLQKAISLTLRDGIHIIS